MSDWPSGAPATVGWDHLATTELAGDAAVITFSGLPDSGLLRVIGYVVNDGGTLQVQMTYNNDVGTTYDRQRVQSGGAGVPVGQRVTGATALEATGAIQDASSESMFIHEFGRGGPGAVANHLGGVGHDAQWASSTSRFHEHASGWDNVADILTRVDFTPSANNFTTGTRIMLEGAAA